MWAGHSGDKSTHAHRTSKQSFRAPSTLKYEETNRDHQIFEYTRQKTNKQKNQNHKKATWREQKIQGKKKRNIIIIALREIKEYIATMKQEHDVEMKNKSRTQST